MGAMADISRYQLYFCRTLAWPPPTWLYWLRYSDFIVQYPLNILAEGLFVIAAVPYLRSLGMGPYRLISYAPVALLFQVYEWCIFIPGYQTLWRVRAWRLNRTVSTMTSSQVERKGGTYRTNCYVIPGESS